MRQNFTEFQSDRASAQPVSRTTFGLFATCVGLHQLVIGGTSPSRVHLRQAVHDKHKHGGLPRSQSSVDIDETNKLL